MWGVSCQFLLGYPLSIKPNTLFPKYVLCIDMVGMPLIWLIFFKETVTLNVQHPRHWRMECGAKYFFNNVTFDQIWHGNYSLQNPRPAKSSLQYHNSALRLNISLFPSLLLFARTSLISHNHTHCTPIHILHLCRNIH